MGHHSSNADDLPEVFRKMIPERNFRDMYNEYSPFGATRRFPMGKLTEADEGEIAFGVAADKKNGKVVIDFGTPVKWLGMDREQAIALAESIHQKADDLLDVTK